LAIKMTVGYWHGQHGVVRAGEQSEREPSFPRIADGRA
jgi:hypothetical protein